MSWRGNSTVRVVSSSRRSTDRNSKSPPLGKTGRRRDTATTSQPFERKPSMALTPIRPLPPATRTLFGGKAVMEGLLFPGFDLLDVAYSPLGSKIGVSDI